MWNYIKSLYWDKLTLRRKRELRIKFREVMPWVWLVLAALLIIWGASDG